MKKIIAIAALSVTALGLTGCGDKNNEPFKDAGVAGRNSAKADIIEMPDGFNNAATKCDHGNRVYVTYHGDGSYGSLSVVKGDPTCKTSASN